MKYSKLLVYTVKAFAKNYSAPATVINSVGGMRGLVKIPRFFGEEFDRDELSKGCYAYIVNNSEVCHS